MCAPSSPTFTVKPYQLCQGKQRRVDIDDWGVSIVMRVPQWLDDLWWPIPLKWMIWGSHVLANPHLVMLLPSSTLLPLWDAQKPVTQPRFRHPMERRTLRWWQKKTCNIRSETKVGKFSGYPHARWVCLKMGYTMVCIGMRSTSKWPYEWRTQPKTINFFGGSHRPPNFRGTRVPSNLEDTIDIHRPCCTSATPPPPLGTQGIPGTEERRCG